jgi:6-pyruvoyltetrahydropterin/6-carboxytetrahydropterin synthase
MPFVSFSRVYIFSAAHRLHSDTLSAGENISVYEKCNNLHGHGHDYKLEVTVSGEPNPQTGMIIPLPELDNKVNKILARLNYKHLDKEVKYFRTIPSTGENIILYLWNELIKEIGKSRLYHLKLWETNNNSFETGRSENR